jgi:hypothetical protein
MAAAIEAQMYALACNYTWDKVDIPTNRKIVDSKWVFIIKHLSSRSIEKYKAQLVAKKYSQIDG